MQKNRRKKMNDWIKPTVIIALYGAILSTITLIWNIVIYLNKTRGSLRVNYTKQRTDINDSIRNVGTLLVRIINDGKIEVNVCSTSIDLCGKRIKLENGIDAKIDATSFGLFSNPNFSLKAGEYEEKRIIVSDLVEFIGNRLKDTDKLRIIVQDTLGHKYYSDKIIYKSLKELARN